VRIICLRSRYPKPVLLSRNMERAAPGFPIWPCTRWGFPCRVACASRGALLPHLFTITAGSRQRLSIFCGTVRREFVLPPACIPRYKKQRLRGIAPSGVRTFLPALSKICRLEQSRLVRNWTPNTDSRKSGAILRPSKTIVTLSENPLFFKVKILKNQ